MSRGQGTVRDSSEIRRTLGEVLRETDNALVRAKEASKRIEACVSGLVYLRKVQEELAAAVAQMERHAAATGSVATGVQGNGADNINDEEDEVIFQGSTVIRKDGYDRQANSMPSAAVRSPSQPQRRGSAPGSVATGVLGDGPNNIDANKDKVISQGSPTKGKDGDGRRAIETPSGTTRSPKKTKTEPVVPRTVPLAYESDDDFDFSG